MGFPRRSHNLRTDSDLYEKEDDVNGQENLNSR
jgi:hypothetical protein